MVRAWGQFPLGKFLAAELNIQYPVKSFAPYLGGCRGWVPSDSLRKFLQEVNLYNSFKHFIRKSEEGLVLSSVANLVHLCGEDVGLNPTWKISCR